MYYLCIVQYVLFVYCAICIYTCAEDKKLLRIVLVKSNRDAANCWKSLLEGQYAPDAWVFDKMEKKLTLERFQNEVEFQVVTTYRPYSGKCSREKPFVFRYKTRISRRKLSLFGRLPIIMWVWPQNFAEKTVTDGSETAKNVKVLSLESFRSMVFYIVPMHYLL